MSELKKIKAKTASEICGKYEQAAEILPLLSEGMSPGDFIDKLVEDDRLQEASRFLAHALPKREAVWWACLCVREAMQDGGDKTAEDLVTLAESLRKFESGSSECASIRDPHSPRLALRSPAAAGRRRGLAPGRLVSP